MCEAFHGSRQMLQAEQKFARPHTARRRRPRLAQQRNKLRGTQGDPPCVGISEDAQHAQFSHQTAGDLH